MNGPETAMAELSGARSIVALDRNDRLLIDCFNGLPNPTLIVDPVGDRIVKANSGVRDMLRYPFDTLYSLRPSRLFSGGLPALIVFTQSVLEKGFGWTNELQCHTGDGREIPVECNARAFTHEAKKLLAITLQDRLALEACRKEAQANDYVRQGLAEWRKFEQVFQTIEQDNRLLLQAAGEGIYGVNADGATTFLNPAAERLLGYKASELVGKNMHHTVHHRHADGSDYPIKQCPIYAAFMDGMVHHVDDEVFWCKDGTPIAVEYTSTPIIERGHLMGAVVVFRDVSDRKEAEQKLREALEQVQALQQRLADENAYLQQEFLTGQNYGEIVGSSQAIRDVVQRIQLVAPTEASVLISGESGTGKELIARAIHMGSARSERPLIRVNCAAIPRELFESEFFGHVRGAFTGATRDRVGRFELADGGTLFLDEVGEIPMDLQGKLLRVLQEGQFERVGENRTRSVDVRIIAATNRPLAQEVEARCFREDLYFRLNVFPVESAALRDRPEDIPLLASHFLRTICRRMNMRDVQLTQGDIRRLKNYHWPGNVRELENVIERAVIISQAGRLKLDLPDPQQAPPIPTTAESSVNGTQETGLLTEEQRLERDRQIILRALEQANGKVFGSGGAAELLGVKPTTLSSRMKKLAIAKPPRSKSN